MKSKLYYGWYIVAAGLIFTTLSSMIFTYGYTAFINPILATFGWSLTQISLANSLRGIETGIFNPIWGKIVDRYDPKKLMFIGVTITAAGIFTLSQTANLFMYYAAFLIIGLGASLCTGMIQIATISRWFKKKLGKANGIFYLGMGLGGLLIPFLVMTIDRIGWQATLLIASILFFLVGNSLAFIYKRRPEDMGLLVDGVEIDDNQNSAAASSNNNEIAITVKQAIRMKPFWYIFVLIFVQDSILGTLSTYIIPYLTDMGINRTVASAVISTFTFLSLFTRIPLGMLVDRFQKKYIIMIIQSFTCAGLILFWWIDGGSPFWMLLLFGIIYGLGLGGLMTLRPPLIVEYFGSRNFGAIYGIISLSTTCAMVVSMPMAAIIFDTFHSYKSWWMTLIVCCIIVIILLASLPRARTSEENA
jgi:MFS family permease